MALPSTPNLAPAVNAESSIDFLQRVLDKSERLLKINKNQEIINDRINQTIVARNDAGQFNQIRVRPKLNSHTVNDMKNECNDELVLGEQVSLATESVASSHQVRHLRV